MSGASGVKGVGGGSSSHGRATTWEMVRRTIPDYLASGSVKWGLPDRTLTSIKWVQKEVETWSADKERLEVFGPIDELAKLEVGEEAAVCVRSMSAERTGSLVDEALARPWRLLIIERTGEKTWRSYRRVYRYEEKWRWMR